MQCLCMWVWCVYIVCHFSCLNLRQGPFVLRGLCVPVQKNTLEHNSDSSLALWKGLSGHNCLFSSSSADHLPKDARIKRMPSPSPTTTTHLGLPVLCHRSLIHSCGYKVSSDSDYCHWLVLVLRPQRRTECVQNVDVIMFYQYNLSIRLPLLICVAEETPEMVKTKTNPSDLNTMC